MSNKESLFNHDQEDVNMSDFFNKAFEQTKQQPLRYAKKAGRFVYQYNDIYLEHIKNLKQFDQTLPENVLFLADTSLKGLKENKGFTYIRNSYTREIENLTQTDILPNLVNQQLEPNIFTKPSAFYLQQPKSCFLSTYQMIFHTITGKYTEQKTILNGAKNNNLLIQNNFGRIDPFSEEQNYNRDIDEWTLLTTLQTPAFRQAFGDIQVGIVKFTGADFNEIKSVVKTIEQRLTTDKKQVSSFFIPFYGSEMVLNGWHNGCLLSVDEKKVLVREPHQSYDRPPKDKAFAKETFVRKWAKAHLRGDLIFAVKPHDQSNSLPR